MLKNKLKNDIKLQIPKIVKITYNHTPQKNYFFRKTIMQREFFFTNSNIKKPINKIIKNQNFNFIKHAKNQDKTYSGEINLKDITKEELEEIRNKNISDKLDRIFKNEIDSNKSNKIDKEYVLKKIENLHKILGYMKIPVLLAIYPLAFSGPFSFNYSILLYSVNNYMVLLILLDSSMFFAAGLLNFLLNFKELIPIREQKSFQRLSQSFIFFSLILYAAKLCNEYLNIHSLFLLLFSNFFLYLKSSTHINLKLFTRDYIFDRMLHMSYNMFLCIALIIIVYWKRKLYNQLI